MALGWIEPESGYRGYDKPIIHGAEIDTSSDVNFRQVLFWEDDWKTPAKSARTEDRRPRYMIET